MHNIRQVVSFVQHDDDGMREILQDIQLYGWGNGYYRLTLEKTNGTYGFAIMKNTKCWIKYGIMLPMIDYDEYHKKLNVINGFMNEDRLKVRDSSMAPYYGSIFNVSISTKTGNKYEFDIVEKYIPTRSSIIWLLGLRIRCMNGRCMNEIHLDIGCLKDIVGIIEKFHRVYLYQKTKDEVLRSLNGESDTSRALLPLGWVINNLVNENNNDTPWYHKPMSYDDMVQKCHEWPEIMNLIPLNQFLYRISSFLVTYEKKYTRENVESYNASITSTEEIEAINTRTFDVTKDSQNELDDVSVEMNDVLQHGVDPQERT
ncbi:hypothetical protein RF11_09987 [Thelohanellus kitauei]|uniref:Uncharacterized protein n=1 Tax=Thelohanellus kitauei TaxID=669202 RepID=A0A0C2IR35_THEKT|nr:hypothetical protein RF11_09987 [Thelohanellus kitauei]